MYLLLLSLPSGCEPSHAASLKQAVPGGEAIRALAVDPVYGTAELTGETDGDRFGYAVSAAGDVNGDGYDDAIVGAYDYDAQTGRAYIYHGSGTGIRTLAATTLDPVAPVYGFGWSVSGAGDVNGDGYDDVIVSALGYDHMTGQAYVYHGSAGGVSTTATSTLTGVSDGDFFGDAVSGAGDVNDDGYADVIVGATSYDGRGGAFVYHGSASGVSSIAATTLTGTEGLSEFGASVSGAGDVNGDGYDDIIVGAYGYSSFTGRAYVYKGSASGVSTHAATTLTGESEGDAFGSSVSDAGDDDADGYDDILVGAFGYGVSTGRAYWYKGSAAGVSTTATTTFTGEAEGDYFGYSVSRAGDVDGDGYDDVLIGAWGVTADAGRVYVYQGSADGLPTTATTTFTGGAEGDQLGYGVAGAGDINGDGYDDLLAGAWGYSDDRGEVQVYCSNTDVCGNSDTADTAEPDTGAGDSGDSSAADSETSAGDSGGGEGEDTETGGEPAEDDTGPPSDDAPGKLGAGCTCTTTGPGPGVPVLAFLPLFLGFRRRLPGRGRRTGQYTQISTAVGTAHRASSSVQEQAVAGLLPVAVPPETGPRLIPVPPQV